MCLYCNLNSETSPQDAARLQPDLCPTPNTQPRFLGAPLRIANGAPCEIRPQTLFHCPHRGLNPQSHSAVFKNYFLGTRPPPACPPSRGPSATPSSPSDRFEALKGHSVTAPSLGLVRTVSALHPGVCVSVQSCPVQPCAGDEMPFGSFKTPREEGWQRATAAMPLLPPQCPEKPSGSGAAPSPPSGPSLPASERHRGAAHLKDVSEQSHFSEGRGPRAVHVSAVFAFVSYLLLGLLHMPDDA